MALGSYGTIRPSDVSPDDVEIILLYTESRDVTNNFTLKKLNAPSILTPYFHNTTTGGNPNVEVLGGLYNLQLPAVQRPWNLHLGDSSNRNKNIDYGLWCIICFTKCEWTCGRFK